MGKINQCLKYVFIGFNAIFAIFGGLMIYSLVKSSAYSHQMSAMGTPSLAWAWVFALCVLGTACLGIFAGHSEKPLVLKIFAGFMVVGMIVMMILGILTAVGKGQVKVVFQNKEMVNAMLRDPDTRAMLNHLQSEFHCCGITGASDWGYDIPTSCGCSSAGYVTYAACKAKPQGASGPSRIYEESCSKYIFGALDIVFNIALGLLFGFAVVALLGLLISLLMIHQIKRHDSVGTSFDMKGY